MVWCSFWNLVFLLCLCVHPTSLQSCPTLCNTMDCSPPGSSVHGILQSRIMGWVAISSSRGSSQPRDWTCLLRCRRIFYCWGIREVLDKTSFWYLILMFTRWLSGKTSACQCQRCKRPGFNPWIRKIPWRRKGQPTPVFLFGKFHGQRSLEGYSPCSCK